MNDEVPAAPVLEGEVLPKKTWDRNPERKGVFVKGDPRLRPGMRKSNKHKLSGDFIKDLAKWYKKDGYKAIERVAREKPDKLLDIIASMVPKEAQVDVAVTHGGGIALGSVELQEAERRTFDLLRRIESRVDKDPGSV